VLSFDPADPFPLFPEGAHSYSDEQRHSDLVDRWIGLRTEETERTILTSRTKIGAGNDEQHWIGLPVRTLLTPYSEIRRMLSLLDLRAGSTLVDLGAGYGRIGFVLARHFPDVLFLGYECVPERAEEARRCLSGTRNAVIACVDLSDPDFIPTEADTYFIYDFGSRAAISKILADLRTHARKRPITVIGRGRASRDTIERSEPWLSAIVPPTHFAHFSIYRSA